MTERIDGWTKWLATRVTTRTGAYVAPVRIAALRAFVKCLRQRGVVTDNPLAEVTLPRGSAARGVFLESPSVLQLVEGSVQPFKALLALAYGAGIEISAILSLAEGDVEPRKKRDARPGDEGVGGTSEIPGVFHWDLAPANPGPR